MIREMAAIGGSVLLDVFTANLFVIVLNQILFKYQQEAGVVIISIILRINHLFLIPVIGLESGIRPIIGYNYGSRQMYRVRQAIVGGLQYGLLIIYLLYGVVVLTSPYFIHYLTKDPFIAAETLRGLKIIYSFFPFMIAQVVASSYFQAIGRPKTAFFLTVLKNIVLLIPLLYVFAYCFGYQGVLYTFPVVDIISAATAFWLLRNELLYKLAKGEPAN
ncbi:MATE family efflux transporter [Paraflavitalea speifideaquila]|uniref:MATE family efflux transporter n=1 Tax=Paraflavitalea speifideaquila TaxID=3076558 RepID=UPI0028EF05F9|nr:MATE family efflux transporter [Paraflavitalea speifideiaquila]